LGANKEFVQLQREVALVEDRVRTLQRSVDEKMGAMVALIRQTLERVNEVRTADAVMQNTLAEKLRQQEKTLGLPMAAFGATLDRVASDTLAVRESIADLNARVKRLDQRLVDMENAARTIQAPPPPPSASEALGSPPAGVTAQGLFQAGLRDQLAGHYELALQEFQDYLKYFGNTELAASSQFHIGEIAYHKGELVAAREAFDLVLEQYPKSGVAPDALYLKAKALEKEGRRSQAVQQLNKLVRAYPNSDAAIRAQAERKRVRTIPGTSRTTSRK
jgi:tol-pal system protein YbgF